jgi:hypothetical protein
LHSLSKSRAQRHHLRLAEDVRKINGGFKRFQGQHDVATKTFFAPT